jgi:hypothetical protein
MALCAVADIVWQACHSLLKGNTPNTHTHAHTHTNTHTHTHKHVRIFEHGFVRPLYAGDGARWHVHICLYLCVPCVNRFITLYPTHSVWAQVFAGAGAAGGGGSEVAGGQRQVAVGRCPGPVLSEDPDDMDFI